VPKFVVSYGSSLGDRAGNIAQAIEAVGAFAEIVALSPVYETAALYMTSQTPFINGVFLAETELRPDELLARLKEIERKIGRQDRGRNMPREIDLDIVWYEDYVSEPPAVPVVPHPGAHERRFVLEPLNEIAPDLLLPGYGVVCDLLADPGVQSQEVRRVADAPILV